AGGLASDARRRNVDGAHTTLEAVLAQLRRGRTEGICLNDVGAGVQVFSVNLAHEIRISDIQFIVTAINVNALRVQHSAHRAIKDVNAVTIKKGSERFHFSFAIADFGLRIADYKTKTFSVPTRGRFVV